MFLRSKQPAVESRWHLPDDLGCRFLVTVDTEEEFDWDGPFERSGHTTITVPMLERYQEFVQKYGIKPVYFVDYSVIENEEAAKFLKTVTAENTASIGAHLHPWVNPPFEEEVNNHNSFAGNLPKELEKLKIATLRKRIQEKTGFSPNIYRAGRYGVGQNTIEILLELGFTGDSSVRSRFDYSGEGGPDFRYIGSDPFWLDGENKLLEIPLTTVFSGVLRRQANWLAGLMSRSSLINAALSRSRMLERIPLTPEGISAREAKEAIDVALDDNLRLLVFSFHSPSLSPGHTPYVQTQDDLNRFYDWWRAIIGHLEERNVKPIGIEELVPN